MQPRSRGRCAAGLPPLAARLPGHVPAPWRLGNALEQLLRLASPLRPPGGTAVGTDAAALRPCRCFLSPPIPLVRGLCQSLRSGWRRLGLARGRTADAEAGGPGGWRGAGHWRAGYRPGYHPRHARGARRSRAGRPPRGASHQGRHGGARRSWVLADRSRRPCACQTRRGLACSVGAPCPHTPRRSLRSMVGRVVFYCRAVCRGPCRPVLPRNPRMPA